MKPPVPPSSSTVCIDGAKKQLSSSVGTKGLQVKSGSQKLIVGFDLFVRLVDNKKNTEITPVRDTLSFSWLCHRHLDIDFQEVSVMMIHFLPGAKH